jgi:hypothetical protein
MKNKKKNVQNAIVNLGDLYKIMIEKLNIRYYKKQCDKKISDYHISKIQSNDKLDLDQIKVLEYLSYISLTDGGIENEK